MACLLGIPGPSRICLHRRSNGLLDGWGEGALRHQPPLGKLLLMGSPAIEEGCQNAHHQACDRRCRELEPKAGIRSAPVSEGMSWNDTGPTGAFFA
jgi:hypothetical protein